MVVSRSIRVDVDCDFPDTDDQEAGLAVDKGLSEEFHEWLRLTVSRKLLTDVNEACTVFVSSEVVDIYWS
jgi:hypothetical protein